MKPLFVALAIGLAGCSGWVKDTQIQVSNLPPTFNNREVVEKAGYHLTKTSRSSDHQAIVEDTFTRFRYPRLISSILPDHRVTYSFWDSGVPPFGWTSPNFDRGVTSLLKELERAGIRRDQIRRIPSAATQN